MDEANNHTKNLNEWLKKEREKYRNVPPKEQKRKWAGLWFPKELWFDEKLEPTEKILLLEINSLDTEKLGCVASNEYLAKFLGTKERQIRTYIQRLKKWDIFIKKVLTDELEFYILFLKTN